MEKLKISTNQTSIFSGAPQLQCTLVKSMLYSEDRKFHLQVICRTQKLKENETYKVKFKNNVENKTKVKGQKIKMKVMIKVSTSIKIKDILVITSKIVNLILCKFISSLPGKVLSLLIIKRTGPIKTRVNHRTLHVYSSIHTCLLKLTLGVWESGLISSYSCIASSSVLWIAADTRGWCTWTRRSCTRGFSIEGRGVAWSLVGGQSGGILIYPARACISSIFSLDSRSVWVCCSNTRGLLDSFGDVMDPMLRVGVVNSTFHSNQLAMHVTAMDMTLLDSRSSSMNSVVSLLTLWHVYMLITLVTIDILCHNMLQQIPIASKRCAQPILLDVPSLLLLGGLLTYNVYSYVHTHSRVRDESMK